MYLAYSYLRAMTTFTWNKIHCINYSMSEATGESHIPHQRWPEGRAAYDAALAAAEMQTENNIAPIISQKDVMAAGFGADAMAVLDIGASTQTSPTVPFKPFLSINILRNREPFTPETYDYTADAVLRAPARRGPGYLTGTRDYKLMIGDDGQPEVYAFEDDLLAPRDWMKNAVLRAALTGDNEARARLEAVGQGIDESLRMQELLGMDVVTAKEREKLTHLLTLHHQRLRQALSMDEQEKLHGVRVHQEDLVLLHGAVLRLLSARQGVDVYVPHEVQLRQQQGRPAVFHASERWGGRRFPEFTYRVPYEDAVRAGVEAQLGTLGVDSDLNFSARTGVFRSDGTLVGGSNVVIGFNTQLPPRVMSRVFHLQDRAAHGLILGSAYWDDTIIFNGRQTSGQVRHTFDSVVRLNAGKARFMPASETQALSEIVEAVTASGNSSRWQAAIDWARRFKRRKLP